jgi:hypothetical protein
MIGKKRFKENNKRDDQLWKEALNIAASKEGLLYPVFNYESESGFYDPKHGINKVGGSTGTVNRSQAYGSDGKPLYRPIRNVDEIYAILLDCKTSKIESEERKHKALVEQAEHEWNRYDTTTSFSERYSTYLDGYVTKDYYLENLYPCQYCSKRFPSEDERKVHKTRTHGVS